MNEASSGNRSTWYSGGLAGSGADFRGKERSPTKRDSRQPTRKFRTTISDQIPLAKLQTNLPLSPA